MYYPVDDSKDLGSERKPLFEVLMKGIDDGKKLLKYMIQVILLRKKDF